MVHLLGRSSSSAKLNSKSTTNLQSTNTHPSQSTPLFEIRLSGTPHDVLILKGPPNDAPSVLLSGTIVLSLNEPMNIKRLSLKMYGTLRMKWVNQYETARGTTLKKPYRWERKVYEHIWSDIDIHSALTNTTAENGDFGGIPRSGRSSGNNSAGSSTTSLKGLVTNKKSKSSTNLGSAFGSTASLTSLTGHGSGSSSSNSSNTLPKGNYEFPFSTILPGHTLESVEGLPGASLVYKLHACIERGRFSNEISTKKHIRILRTLTPDSLELVETMAVDNTWPDKVEYSISIPSRAVAIGSATPIHITLVPLAKGLKLGKVKVLLQEYYSCVGSFGPPHSGERVITDMVVASSDQNLNDDRWEINATLPIPPSLAKCTQDVDILTNAKVRHKLKFIIGLLNPDGHVSELRASLPVVLFVSPFVALAVRNMDRQDSVAENAFNDIPSDDESAIPEDDVIFSPDPEVVSTDLAVAGSPMDAAALMDIERAAPPNYGNHIYDRLWSEISVENTPDGSGPATPAPGTPLILGNSGENLNDRNLGRFTENLRRLHLQQQHMHETPSLDSLAINSREQQQQPQQQQQQHGEDGGEDEDEEEEGGLSFAARIPNRVIPQPAVSSGTPINEISSATDYFTSHRQHHSPPSSFPLHSPGLTSPSLTHLSRAPSTTNLSSTSPQPHPNLSKKDWDAVGMSQVPSYQTAMRSSTNLQALSPSYDGNRSAGGYFDLYDHHSSSSPSETLVRPKSIHLKSSSLSNSRAHSTQFLTSLRNSSSTNLSSSFHSSNTSNNNNNNNNGNNTNNNNEDVHSFTKAPILSRTNSKSILSSSFNSSMTPVSGHSASNDRDATSAANPPHMGSSKGGTFANLFGLHRGTGGKK